ncbi:MAG: histidine triad nucleotide-binding protein [Burkholderiales bacterium PBB3]|nr:MAG: histidine triad nucleotide-binding protein [Burkholderiales bacterium PBB3]
MSTSTQASHDPNCLFCKIIAKQIPSKTVYEDDQVYAFHDIHPWAPVHFLIVPKAHIASMAHVGTEHAALMGHIMALVPKLALQEGCNPYPEGGYRLVTNTGAEGGQEVHHLHFHVMGGSRPWLRG